MAQEEFEFVDGYSSVDLEMVFYWNLKDAMFGESGVKATSRRSAASQYSGVDGCYIFAPLS